MAEIIKLKKVILRSDETFVESQDKSRFVDVRTDKDDVKTAKDSGRLDFFIPGSMTTRTGETKPVDVEAVFLRRDYSPLIRNHAARMSDKIRREPASLAEAAQARLYFGIGKELAELALRELAAVLKTQQLSAEQPQLPKTSRLPANKELIMPLKFKNAAGDVREMKATMQLVLYSESGQFHWRLNKLSCTRNGTEISIVDPARLKPLESSLLSIFKGLVGGPDGIEAKLKKYFEELRAREKAHPSRRHPW